MAAYLGERGDAWPYGALRAALCYVRCGFRWMLSILLHRKVQLTPSYTGPRMHAVRRVAAAWAGSSSSCHPLAKPDWVKAAVLQLAHDLPNVGCRTLANNFNLAHVTSNQTVSKTWVASLLKAREAALALARRKSQRRRRFTGFAEPIQRVWGVDLTGLPLTSGETVDVWGIVDHGSRTVLQLQPVARFNSLI
jgi:hypothetical protein